MTWSQSYVWLELLIIAPALFRPPQFCNKNILKYSSLSEDWPRAGHQLIRAVNWRILASLSPASIWSEACIKWNGSECADSPACDSIHSRKMGKYAEVHIWYSRRRAASACSAWQGRVYSNVRVIVVAVTASPLLGVSRLMTGAPLSSCVLSSRGWSKSCFFPWEPQECEEYKRW